MLIYHPMFDPYHCALRIVCIALDSERKEIEWDRLRVLDFFVTFPHLLKTIRLPQELRTSKKLLKSIPEPYENLPNTVKLFYQLTEIQASAAKMLTASRFFDREALLRGVIALGPYGLRPSLDQVIDHATFRSSEWYRFLVHQLGRLPLMGKDGLKERSGLMEFRHDPV